MKDEILDICATKDYIALLTTDNVLVYENNLEKYLRIDIPSGARNIMPIDDNTISVIYSGYAKTISRNTNGKEIINDTQ